MKLTPMCKNCWTWFRSEIIAGLDACPYLIYIDRYILLDRYILPRFLCGSEQTPMCRNRKIMCKICDWAIWGKLLNESKKEKIGLSKEQIWLAEERWADKIGVNNVQIYLFSPGTFGFLFINVKWLNKICYLCHAFREIYFFQECLTV